MSERNISSQDQSQQATQKPPVEIIGSDRLSRRPQSALSNLSSDQKVALLQATSLNPLRDRTDPFIRPSALLQAIIPHSVASSPEKQQV